MQGIIRYRATGIPAAAHIIALLVKKYWVMGILRSNKVGFSTVNIFKKELIYNGINVSVIWYKSYVKEMAESRKLKIIKETCENERKLIIAPFDSFKRPDLDSSYFGWYESQIGIGTRVIKSEAGKLQRLEEIMNSEQSVDNIDKYYDALHQCDFVFNSFEKLYLSSYQIVLHEFSTSETSSPFFIESGRTRHFIL